MSSKKPNIVFIFSDQQRWDTLGCYGQTLPISPNLDRMAAEGVRFEHAFTCQPVCGPVRATLQTGKYATEVGCEVNHRHLPLDADTLADRMKDAGYTTGYIGKWHLSSGPNRFDPDCAPDNRFLAIPEAHRGGYDYWLAADALEFTSHAYDGHMFDNDGNVRLFPTNRYRVDAQTDWVLEYLEQQTKEEPFFLFVSYIEPHHQNDHNCYEGPKGSRERWSNYDIPGDLAGLPGDWVEQFPDYLGCCHALDGAVGRVRKKLAELEMDEDTVIIYTSGHGSHFRTRNGEYKRSCHDGCLRIPMIFSGPGFEGGEVNENLASLIDLPKTVLSIAGGEVPKAWQGMNLQQAVGADLGREAVFAQLSEDHTGRTIRTKRWKYAVWMPEESGCWTEQEHEGEIVYHERFLYDLKNDPHERNNLFKDPAHTALRADLAEMLKAEMAQANETVPTILPA
jgi:arylsulfatase A-like enzyme